MLSIPPSLPQLFALFFLAALAALLGEQIAGAAPKFGFFGAYFLAILGVLILISLPLPVVGFEPRLEDLPVVRSVLGGAVLAGLFGYYRKRRSVR